jgi:hypothetical protein
VGPFTPAGSSVIRGSHPRVIFMGSGDDIYAVAGNSMGGFAGDGRLGIQAELNQPAAVAVDGAGNLLIADSGNNRIREVAG